MKKITFICLILAGYTDLTAQSSLTEPMVANEASPDIITLSKLNAQFIQNFLHNDTIAHNQIIYKDFICITGNGQIISRDEYMKGWASGYNSTDFKSFKMENQFIRVMDNIALVRAETVAVTEANGTINRRRTLYTDTYIKEEGRWWCIQAQLTSVAGN